MICEASLNVSKRNTADLKLSIGCRLFVDTLYGIPSAGGNPKKLIDRQRFEEGFEELLRVRKPHTIIVYGSANYSCLAAVSTQSRKNPFPTLFFYRFHVHTTKKFAIFTEFSIAKYKNLL